MISHLLVLLLQKDMSIDNDAEKSKIGPQLVTI